MLESLEGRALCVFGGRLFLFIANPEFEQDFAANKVGTMGDGKKKATVCSGCVRPVCQPPRWTAAVEGWQCDLCRIVEGQAGCLRANFVGKKNRQRCKMSNWDSGALLCCWRRRHMHKAGSGAPLAQTLHQS